MIIFLILFSLFVHCHCVRNLVDIDNLAPVGETCGKAQRTDTLFTCNLGDFEPEKNCFYGRWGECNKRITSKLWSINLCNCLEKFYSYETGEFECRRDNGFVVAHDNGYLSSYSDCQYGTFCYDNKCIYRFLQDYEICNGHNASETPCNRDSTCKETTVFDSNEIEICVPNTDGNVTFSKIHTFTTKVSDGEKCNYFNISIGKSFLSGLYPYVDCKDGLFCDTQTNTCKEYTEKVISSSEGGRCDGLQVVNGVERFYMCDYNHYCKDSVCYKVEQDIQRGEACTTEETQNSKKICASDLYCSSVSDFVCEDPIILVERSWYLITFYLGIIMTIVTAIVSVWVFNDVRLLLTRKSVEFYKGYRRRLKKWNNKSSPTPPAKEQRIYEPIEEEMPAPVPEEKQLIEEKAPKKKPKKRKKKSEFVTDKDGKKIKKRKRRKDKREKDKKKKKRKEKKKKPKRKEKKRKRKKKRKKRSNALIDSDTSGSDDSEISEYEP